MNTIITPQMLSGIYKMIFFVIVAVPTVLSATIEQHIIEAELDVPQGITIKTKGPVVPDFSFNGTINSSTESGVYSLLGKGNETLVKVHKHFNIYTWDQSKVKLVLTIDVEGTNAEVTQNILTEFSIDLKIQADNSLNVDCLAGLELISIKNGWFRSDEQTLTFSNGNKYKFNFLKMKAELHIPKSSNLNLNMQYTKVTLGKLDGELYAKYIGGSLNAEFVDVLEGTFHVSNMNIRKIKTGNISAHRSSIKIDKAENLTVGKLALGIESSIFYDPVSENKHSSLNKYMLKELGSLNVFSSLNDVININRVDDLVLQNVAFSDINVTRLGTKAKGNSEYGILNIYSIDNEKFEAMDINSSYGQIKIDIKKLNGTEIKLKYNPNHPIPFLQSLKDASEQNITTNPGFSISHNKNKHEVVILKSNEESTVRKRMINIYCNLCDLNLK